MCTLKESTDLKSVTMYKVMLRHDGKYYSMFSGLKMTLGPVEEMRLEANGVRVEHQEPIDKTLLETVLFRKQRTQFDHDIFCFADYRKDGRGYHEEMPGRTMGFKSLDAARMLGKTYRLEHKWFVELVIIKLQVSATENKTIWKGNSEGMNLPPSYNVCVTYAGPNVDSFEEVEEVEHITYRNRWQTSSCST